jgi:predicted AAA+ superfamily ATPase
MPSGSPPSTARTRTESTVGRSAARLWFSSYLQTYLERDVRAVAAIRDLVTFRRFLAVVASRTGQLLNKTDLAAPLGVSVPTITHWLDILEVTGQIIVIPPFFENFGKRLVKTPKVHVVDSGLACHLLGIASEAELNRSPFLGPLFEGLVAAEVVKAQVNAGGRGEVYYFRDQQGLEVDLAVPAGNRGLLLLEAKASRTVTPKQAEPLVRLGRAAASYKLTSLVVHRRRRREPLRLPVRPGVGALPVELVHTVVGRR